MKAVVIYDSQFGNTEKVAKAIAKVLDGEAIKVSDVDVSKLEDYDVFAVGSPTHAWNMSSGMKGFFKQLKGKLFKEKKAAAFDTKFDSRFAGSAAKKIQSKLKKHGFDIVMEPVSFFVTGREGPLADGEIEKVKVFSTLK